LTQKRSETIIVSLFWFLLHHVCGVVSVPPAHQLIAGFANVLTVEDRAGENTGDVQAVAESGVCAVLQVERAGLLRARPPIGTTCTLYGKTGAMTFHLLCIPH
jgi:hypothetical protein